MLVQYRCLARIVYIDWVLLTPQHARPCHFRLLGRLLHLCELTFVSTSDADAVSIARVPCDCHTLLTASFLSFAHLFLDNLSDLARASIVPFRLFHVGYVHGAVQRIREGRWGCLVGDCPEVARVAAGRRARNIGIRWVRTRVLNAGQLLFDNRRYLLLYDASDLLLHNAGY